MLYVMTKTKLGGVQKNPEQKHAMFLAEKHLIRQFTCRTVQHVIVGARLRDPD